LAYDVDQGLRESAWNRQQGGGRIPSQATGSLPGRLGTGRAQTLLFCHLTPGMEVSIIQVRQIFPLHPALRH